MLAQRNLQVTSSDNPGPASAHRVPQTFAIKPSTPPPLTGPLAGRPDELLIFWGDTPVGSTAQIYWPGVSADEVVTLADWMYGVHPLRAADPHTIEVKTLKGVTFVPIPVGYGGGLCGTVQHRSAADGQNGTGIQYRGAAREQKLRPAAPPPPPPGPKIAAHGNARGGEHHGASTSVLAVAVARVWERYIVGSFQVKIPVSTAAAMRPAEETKLAILKRGSRAGRRRAPGIPCC